MFRTSQSEARFRRCATSEVKLLRRRGSWPRLRWLEGCPSVAPYRVDDGQTVVVSDRYSEALSALGKGSSGAISPCGCSLSDHRLVPTGVPTSAAPRALALYSSAHP